MKCSNSFQMCSCGVRPVIFSAIVFVDLHFVHCHDEIGLGLIVSLKGDLHVTAYKDILDNCLSNRGATAW